MTGCSSRGGRGLGSSAPARRLVLIAASRVPWGARRPPLPPRTGCVAGAQSGWWAISQTKHASSRATATATVVRFLPRALSRCAQRRCSRFCARHAASIGGWLAGLAALERQRDTRRTPIVPGGFDQQPARVRAAGLGDRARPAPLAGRLL